MYVTKKKPSVSLTCFICKKDFRRAASLVKNPERSFCEIECYRVWQRSFEKIEKICEYCSNTFKTARGEALRRKFCSSECRKNKLGLRDSQCNFCSKDIRISQSNINSNNYCGRSCRYADKKRKNEANRFVVKICEICTSEFTTRRVNGSNFCSRRCRIFSVREEPERSIRIALESNKIDLFLSLIKENSTINDKGCWEVDFLRCPGNYPLFRHKGAMTLHRVISILIHGEPELGDQSHHKCAVSKCVNPEHLQWVKAKDNTAEMMERTAYLNKIKSLEKRVMKLETLLSSHQIKIPK